MKPLADKIRPESIDDIIGQEHITEKNGVLRKIIESKKIPNLILYGPPGSGKTTIANIISKNSCKKFFKINGTTTNTDEIKNIINNTYTFDGVNKILLYIDEIHYLSKKQQQLILEFIENGSITLIASTTENITTNIFPSILSRSITLSLKPITSNSIKNKLKSVINKEFKNYNFSDESIDLISKTAYGDLRKALNILELCINSYDENKKINIDDIENLNQSSIIYADTNSDSHYDHLSFLQKSIRGSDPDAASIALALLIKKGVLESICRRLLVICCEDVGLAYPQAISIVKSCVDSALTLGFPEARIPLSQAVILLSTLPKSNSAYKAINDALLDIDNFQITIPSNLCDNISNNFKIDSNKYMYPHDYTNNYVKQNYMPKEIESKTYYTYGDNKFENSLKDYWSKIK